MNILSIFKKNTRLKLSESDRLMNELHRQKPLFPNVDVAVYKIPKGKGYADNFLIKIMCVVRFKYKGLFYKTLYFEQTWGELDKMDDLLRRAITRQNETCMNIINHTIPNTISDEFGNKLYWIDDYQQEIE